MMGGSGDKEYFSVYNDILPQLIGKFGPDIILVSAGYDICTEDPLSDIRVSNNGIRGIVKGILSSAQSEIQNPKFRIPVIFALEGGYDLTALAESVMITIEETMKD